MSKNVIEEIYSFYDCFFDSEKIQKYIMYQTSETSEFCFYMAVVLI